ncbi:putative PEP-binding protein [Synechococcus sp. PCC 6312]|uniref:putative PEP-binding protein n=1 Tax=Synechococcus sp. (strain ATCC 27167 / PCC 6312) TaxID=195253 RepID=UPI00029F1795|nr:putative PEP-binding protein [Synechococcus sp. PCC 6312]AFY62462.1 phosphoenolpyruvate synthase/pyruvate phosphate dikinase [Synechococcus sp. PCC 6312]
MTIAFLQLHQDCQCLAPGLVSRDAQCQDCLNQGAVGQLLLSPPLQHLLQLEQHQVRLTAGAILLNGAWEVYRASLAEPWASFQASLKNSSAHFPWQQAAEKFQISFPELPGSELEPLMQVIQAWNCDYLRLIPYFSHPSPEKQLPPDFWPGLVVEVNQLSLGLEQLFGNMFQARYLIQWQQRQINPLDLGLEVLIQSVAPCIATGCATFAAGVWHITAVPGLADGETTMAPDRYDLEATTFKLRQTHLGQKDHADTLSPGLGVTLMPLPATIDQDMILSDDHLENLTQLLSTLPRSIQPKPLCYGWQIPTETGLAQISRVSDHLPEHPPNSHQLHLKPLATGIIATPGQALGPALVITESMAAPNFGSQQSGFIWVVVNINPEWLPGLRGAAGLVCERGGLASHGAILARELGLPAVIGVLDATRNIRNGDVLYLDGQTGHVAHVTEITPVLQPRPPLLFAPPSGPPPPTPRPTLRTQLYVNLSQSQALEQLPKLPIAGIGLLRSENIFLERLSGQHPTLWFREHRQAQLQARFRQGLEPFFAAFAPRPIFYRSLDLRSHELRGLVGGNQYEPDEENPVLGLRGVARSCLYPELLQLELATLQQIHDSHPGPIRFVLPFVRSCEEVVFCQEQLNWVGLSRVPDFELWVMAEVPGILFMLTDLAGLGVKGISIGSNDLTQLLLGVDREHSSLGEQFNENHPAVKAAISQLIRTAQNLGLACSLCGEAASVYPDWVEWLAGLGIDGISVTPEALGRTWETLERF